MAHAARAAARFEHVLTCVDEVLAPAAAGLAAAPQEARRQAQMLGIDALLQLGRLAAAEGQARALLRQWPADADAHSLLGLVLQRAGRVGDAAASWREAIRLRPADARSRFNLAVAEEQAGELDAARHDYEQAAAQLAGRAGPWSRVAALAARCCDFDAEARAVAALEAALALPAPPGDLVEPLLACFLPLSDAACGEVLRRQATAATAAAASHSPPAVKAAASRGDGRPLRIGYLSPDFGAHAVGALLHPVLAAHDPAAVELHLYALRRRSDPLADAYRGLPGYVDVAGDPAGAIARRIAADGIDILVDLGGYTDGAMPAVAAARPAPVQMAWLGLVGSMAAPFIDYQIVDAALVPAQLEHSFDEALLRLPGSFLPLSPALPSIDRAAARAAFGLPAGLLFACFNNAYKIDREVLRAWAAIVGPRDAHLLLAVADVARARLRAEWSALGGRDDQLLFVERIPAQEHMHRAAACDLFLDTFRYHAGATAVSALRAGLPVLCREGRLASARMGVSLNRALGLGELVVADDAAYVQRAGELADRPAELAAVRDRLAVAMRGVAADPARFARTLERAYREAWKRHLAGEAPASFNLPPSDPAP